MSVFSIFFFFAFLDVSNFKFRYSAVDDGQLQKKHIYLPSNETVLPSTTYSIPTAAVTVVGLFNSQSVGPLIRPTAAFTKAWFPFNCLF